MKEVTFEEMTKTCTPEVRRRILDNARVYRSTHVVRFENLDLWSSQCGNGTFLCVGPNNTYKNPEECKEKHLYDLPSRRQYPVEYCILPEEKE